MALTQVSLWMNSADIRANFSYISLFSFPISSNFLFINFSVSSSSSALPNECFADYNVLSSGATLSSELPSRTTLLWENPRCPFLRCSFPRIMHWERTHDASSPPAFTLRSSLWSITLGRYCHYLCETRVVLRFRLAFRRQKSTNSHVYYGLIKVLLLCFTDCSLTKSSTKKLFLEFLYERLEKKSVVSSYIVTNQR